MVKLIIFSILLISYKSFSYEIALTIDDLPIVINDKNVDLDKQETIFEIIKVIKNNNIPVYGFATGITAKMYKELMELWIKSGIKIGNHSFYHKDIATVDLKTAIDDIKSADIELTKILRYSPRYYRYPFLSEGDSLEKRSAVRKYLSSNNYKIAPVTIDTRDWSFDNKDEYIKHTLNALKEADELSKVLYKRSIKHIMLIHANRLNSKALSHLIFKLKEIGVKFISLEEALTDPIYEEDTKFVANYGVTFLVQKSIMTKNIGLHDDTLKYKVDNYKNP